MPGPRRHRQLLVRLQHALLAGRQERDPAGSDLEVLGTVVVDVLALVLGSAAVHALWNALLADSEDTYATSMAFSPVNGFQTASPARTRRT